MAGEWDVVSSKPLGEWDVVSSKPAPTAPKPTSTPKPEPRDPRARAGNAIWEAVKGVGDVLNPMPLIKQYASPQGVLDVMTGNPGGPIARGVIEGAVDQGKQAVEAVKRGNEIRKSGVPWTRNEVFGPYSEAFGHAVAAVVPGVGPMAAQAADTIAGAPGKRDKYGNETQAPVEPNIPRGVGQAAALIGGPRATKAVVEGVSDVAGAAKARLTRIDPKQGMTQGLKPKSTNLGFDVALDRAMPELKQTEQIAGTPITNLNQLEAATKLSKQRIWRQYEKIMGPQAQRGIDASGVARAMLEAVPEKSAAQNPGILNRIAARAKAYERPLTIQQLEDYLQTNNAEVDAHYGKYPAARGVDLRGNPLIAAKVAEGNMLRQILYDALDNASEGGVPAELKRRYGALSNVEREIQRRKNVAARQQPDSLSEQVGKWSGIGDIVKGGVRAIQGDVRGLADIGSGVAKRRGAKWIKEQQTTDALIRRAFENYSGSPTPLDMPPPFQPRALLGKPDIITPPPADASGVRSTPGMANPPNPRRALPPAGDIAPPVPPDESFVRSAPAMPMPPNPRRALPAPGQPPQDVIDLELGSQYGDVFAPRLLRRRPPDLQPPGPLQ